MSAFGIAIVRRRVIAALGALSCLSACLPVLAAPPDVTVNDKNVFPESITSTAAGEVILGSMGQPVIFRAVAGSSTAEPWIHLDDRHDTTLGVLADTSSNTLWACVRMTNPPSDTQAPGPARAGPAPSHSVLRAFDLKSGQVRASYALPGATSLCNDIAIAPDRTVYISDTTNARVLRLDRRAGKLTLWLEDRAHLAGIDGLTFLGPTLYVNNVQTGHLYRIPMNAAGEAGSPVDIALSQPLQGPDGMRAANGRIYVAENRAGRIAELTIAGDQASTRVIKEGYQMPTAVSPTGGVLWVGESKLNYLFDAKLHGQDPGPFRAYALALR